LRRAIVIGVALAAGRGQCEAAEPPRPTIIGYVFPQDRMLEPGAIAADKLSHVNFAFADVREGRVVEGRPQDAANLAVLAGLRREHPHLKLLVSVGGWSGSGGFSDAALTPKSRERFALSAVAFVRRHDLDGFDVDWEYPGLPGDRNRHRPEDKQNFTSLMAELRTALDRDAAASGRHRLLTFAAGAFPDYLSHTEMAKLSSSVDFVNLMAYDFRVAEGGDEAGHHANLYVHPNDPRQSSADRAVQDFLAAGVPAAKLVLGIPFYGRAWSGIESIGGLYRHGRRPAERMDTSYAALAALAGRDGWVRGWDRVAQAPYLLNAERKTFVSYDDPESLLLKCRYVRERGLAGVMFWEYHADPTGALLDALVAGLRGPPTAR
jgi:chitinase